MNNFVLSKHAREQLTRREIPEDIVRKILSENEAFGVEDGLTVYQGLISETDKPYLIRIFINKNASPYLIVTVYKTSKIKKYL